MNFFASLCVKDHNTGIQSVANIAAPPSTAGGSAVLFQPHHVVLYAPGRLEVRDLLAKTTLLKFELMPDLSKTYLNVVTDERRPDLLFVRYDFGDALCYSTVMGRLLGCVWRNVLGSVVSAITCCPDDPSVTCRLFSVHYGTAVVSPCGSLVFTTGSPPAYVDVTVLDHNASAERGQKSSLQFTEPQNLRPGAQGGVHLLDCRALGVPANFNVIYSPRMSDDGRLLAFGARDTSALTHHVLVYDVADADAPQLILHYKAPPPVVGTLLLLPINTVFFVSLTVLALVSRSGVLFVSVPLGGKVVARIVCKAHSNRIDNVVLVGANEILLTGSSSRRLRVSNNVCSRVSHGDDDAISGSDAPAGSLFRWTSSFDLAAVLQQRIISI